MSMGNVVNVVWGVRFARADYRRMCDAIERDRLDTRNSHRAALETFDGGEFKYTHGVIAVDGLTTQVTWSGNPVAEVPIDAAKAIEHEPQEKHRVAMAALQSLAAEAGIACEEPRWWITAGYY